MFPVESLPWRVFVCSHFACPLSTRVQEFACLACWFSGLVGWLVCLFVCLFGFVLLCFVWFCFVLFAYVLFCLCLLVSMYLYVYICRYE